MSAKTLTTTVPHILIPRHPHSAEEVVPRAAGTYKLLSSNVFLIFPRAIVTTDSAHILKAAYYYDAFADLRRRSSIM
jgi:hypothetical protein